MIKISLFVVFSALATINLSLAQNSTHHQHASFFGLPMPFDFSQLPFFGRQTRDTEAAEARQEDQGHQEDEGHQDRFFFSLFSPISTLVSCNSTTQAGATCLTCTQALRCGGSNVGRLQQCRGFQPYCNLGRCSFFPGALCTTASSTSSASSASSTNSTG